MTKKQITLADLAKELGISTATVSRALKDYPDISNETKARVLDLAKRLNYRPNSLAAGLRKRESQIIGVIIPSIVNHFFSSVIKGIMEVAYDRNYRVMLCQTNESYEKELADTRALFASRIDGLLVSVSHGTKDFSHFEELLDAGVPVVFFDKVPEGLSHASKVIVDDYQGAFQIVSHLIEQGYKRIAHFRGPLIASTSRNRLRGYQDALKAHNIPVDDKLVFACEDITMEEGKRFARVCMEMDQPCDAIFCITDSVGMGAMVAIKETGRIVPDDIAVAGFSDWIMSSVIEPNLSSVAQPSLDMGRKAAELLLEEIKARKDETAFDAQHIILKTEVKIRKSTSPTRLAV
ncbi:MAG: LacI family DNA-binding transcriptional regulator [Bacteroidota bacterium]